MSVSSWSQSLNLPGLIPKLGESLGRLLPPISIRVGWGLQKDSGILNAVPKKKVSHQKKRQKQLSPRNQINPLNNLNRCPSCGHYKRAHTLCMRCVSQIQRLWKAREEGTQLKNQEPPQEQKLHPIDKRILYPGRHVSEEEKILKKKEYLYTRPRTLPVERKRAQPKGQRPRG